MEKLMLAMSGGVDSTAALFLLKDKYDVTGATLKLLNGIVSAKDAEQGLKDAKAAAEKYGVPHITYDFSERFGDTVIEPFISSYIKGETPNPCVSCNKRIKFGELLYTALGRGFSRFATGHYARVVWDEEKKRYLLKKALNADGTINDKDQSYVLYNLTQGHLKYIIFPLGNLAKDEVRSFAEKVGLEVSKKPDSQDICFIPGGDYTEFLINYGGYIPEPGKIVDKEGKVLGVHEGLCRYTIGQRRGLKIAHPFPLYVVGKDAVRNTVTAGAEEDLYTSRLIAGELNWIALPSLTEKIRVKAKTRYRHKEEPCTVSPLPGGKASVEFDEPQRAITMGQSVVFYDSDTVVGGGIIVG